MGKLIIKRMVLGAVSTNCYIVYREGNKRALCIDPSDKGTKIYEYMKELGVELDTILLTHSHFDHILGVERLLELAKVKMIAGEDERELCENPELNMSKDIRRPTTVAPDYFCKDGEILEFKEAQLRCRVLFTPGHTKGSICFYFEEDKVLISGDTLFLESVGRADLPTGSMGQLVRSVKEKLFPLDDDTLVYPGHGDETTIGHEKKYNPYVG